VEYRADKLRGMFAASPLELLEPANSAALWRAVRDAAMFGSTNFPVWARQRCADGRPSGDCRAEGGACHSPLFRLVGRAHLDRGERRRTRWACGPHPRRHICMRRRPCDVGARQSIAAGGRTALRATAEALAALSKRLKSQFDPRGILNPGRMAAEF
jgi:glycolate oxidase FAD binding subunit